MNFQNEQVLPSDTSGCGSTITRDKHTGFLALALGDMWTWRRKLKGEGK